jgi:hypothetical protein
VYTLTASCESRNPVNMTPFQPEYARNQPVPLELSIRKADANLRVTATVTAPSGKRRSADLRPQPGSSPDGGALYSTQFTDTREPGFYDVEFGLTGAAEGAHNAHASFQVGSLAEARAAAMRGHGLSTGAKIALAGGLLLILCLIAGGIVLAVCLSRRRPVAAQLRQYSGVRISAPATSWDPDEAFRGRRGGSEPPE